jgi:hypothetical protein
VIRDSDDHDELVDHVREMDARGASDDEVAAWLRSRVDTIKGNATVLALARGLGGAEAYAALNATATWRVVTTRHQVTLPNGESTSLSGRGKRTFAPGDLLNLPHTPEPPYDPRAGRGTVWRVASVEPADRPDYVARIVIEPVKRLDPAD